MLSVGAMRQLLWVWFESVGLDPADYVQVTKKSEDKYVAVRELESAGLLRVTRTPGKSSRYELSVPLSNNNTIPFISGTVKTALGGHVQGGYSPYREPPTGGDVPLQVATSRGVGQEEETHFDTDLDEAYYLDLLPTDGQDTPGAAHTAFRERRRLQREFVQRMWAKYFPHLPPLIDANANEFLRTMGDSAEEICALFQKLEGNPKASLAYLRGCTRKWKDEQAKSAEAISTANPEEPQIWGTPENLAKSRQLQEELRMMGYHSADE